MESDARIVEREVKLKVDLAFELPDLRSGIQTVRQPGQDLRATYFDTADFRLWQRGITFRHRIGEGGAGKWTVKLPTDGAGTTLDRTEISWNGSSDAFPPEATRLFRGIVRRSVLHEVVELVTTRRRLSLCHADGTPWGELDDDTVSVVGGHRDGYTFRQLELELEGAEDGVGDVTELVLQELTQAGAHRDNETKLAKALGLETQPRTGHTAPEVGPKSTVGDVIRASIVGGLDRLLDLDYQLRLNLSDPDPHAIHQARVASRRLRSDLKTLGPALDPVWLGHIRTELKWLGSVLGAVRDVDVLAARLLEHQVEGPRDADGLRELHSRLETQRLAASQRVAAMLTEDDRYLDLLDRLHAAAEFPPFFGVAATVPAAKELPLLVGRRWSALRKRVRRAGRHPSDAQLHQVRIGGKQLRYAAEMAAPVIGKPARRTARSAEQLQTILGEHHDAVTAEEWLSREALTLPPAAAFTAGRLAAGRRYDQEQLRHRWPATWKAIGAKQRHRWLR